MYSTASAMVTQNYGCAFQTKGFLMLTILTEGIRPNRLDSSEMELM